MPADTASHRPGPAELYDLLTGTRDDLAPYLHLAAELAAHHVLDLGCGTGTLALALAARGLEVTAADPDQAGLAVARAKPGAGAVRWIPGDAGGLPRALEADLAVMTGNAVQEITDDRGWQTTLEGLFTALRPGGHLAFETRDPTRRAWEDWRREATRTVVRLPGGGRVEHWLDLLDVRWPLVGFRSSFAFEHDGPVLTRDSTLRFRTRTEVEDDLAAAGFRLREVRDAPDRPGRELVFLADRP